MSESSAEAPKLNTPPAASEVAPVESAPEAEAPAAEKPVSSPESSAQTLAPPPAINIPLPGPPMAADDTKADVTATTQPTTTDLSDDGDLIEKEWVEKAKSIVERTREDPHQQSEELTVVKADYMKKRYNKALKLNK